MSIFTIANSGLNAFQSAMTVVGNNIANSKTQGYSRQSIGFNPSPPQRFAGSFIGTGVQVSTIYRNADQFINAQVVSTQSAKSQYEAFYQQSSQIDKLLSLDGTSISTSLSSFFDAFSKLNNGADVGAYRDTALKQGQLLVQQFNFFQSKIDEYQDNSTAQITQSVSQINQLASGIAAVNQMLLGSANSPELLDQRDLLLHELGKYVDVTTFDQGDGSINVAIGSGEMLVAGAESRTMSVSAQLSNVSGTKIMLGTGAGQIDISDKLNSGMVGGLLSYEQNVLGVAGQMLGQMAIGLAQEFNAQHQLGMDMNSLLGQNFFNDFNSSALQLKRSAAATTNTGTGVLSVAISDISQTKISDYQLVVSDAATNQLRLIRQSDGSSTPFTWSNNPPLPPAGQIVVDGMTISVDNMANLQDGDNFIITPTRGASGDLTLQITDSQQIAVASPVSTFASLSNTGAGTITLGTVLNTSAVTNQYEITFISDTQFNLFDATNNITTGPFPFVPNTENSIQIPDSFNPSYTVTLAGIPKTGDQFTSQFNAGGIGNSGNGLLLSGLQQSKFFSNGTKSIFDQYSDLIVDVGEQTKLAKNSYDASDILYKNALSNREQVSGVNLDEEGANLLKFKQAYEAAGKLMAIANQMMNVLFEMMR